MSRITIIQCNGCGKRLRGHRHWPRRRDLYRLGWIVAGDDTHYCPACAIRECPAYTLLYQFFPKDTGKSKVK